MNDGDPTPMQAACIAIHEMFTALVDGGFTEDQALTLCARWLAATGMTPD